MFDIRPAAPGCLNGCQPMLQRIACSRVQLPVNDDTVQSWSLLGRRNRMNVRKYHNRVKASDVPEHSDQCAIQQNFNGMHVSGERWDDSSSTRDGVAVYCRRLHNVTTSHKYSRKKASGERGLTGWENLSYRF